MGSINVGRVILGGLLAGLVVNIAETILNLLVVAQGMEEALRARNLPPVGGPAIGGFVLETFLVGIVTVWLYAAIRPRFGAGAGTAVIAGAVVWFFAYLHQSFALVLMGVFPAKVMVVGTVWGLVEIIVASIAGAWVYKE
jgi:hypothetical protein